mmetsp:Transcript_41655/g.126295  ORF Transcript_41655/g.126295 Transcript_41655/m.126295 type:complete len:401 (-) Transcript_41655:1899-3101(-)
MNAVPLAFLVLLQGLETIVERDAGAHLHTLVEPIASDEGGLLFGIVADASSAPAESDSVETVDHPGIKRNGAADGVILVLVVLVFLLVVVLLLLVVGRSVHGIFGAVPGAPFGVGPILVFVAVAVAAAVGAILALLLLFLFLLPRKLLPPQYPDPSHPILHGRIGLTAIPLESLVIVETIEHTEEVRSFFIDLVFPHDVLQLARPHVGHVYAVRYHEPADVLEIAVEIAELGVVLVSVFGLGGALLEEHVLAIRHPRLVEPRVQPWIVLVGDLAMTVLVPIGLKVIDVALPRVGRPYAHGLGRLVDLGIADSFGLIGGQSEAVVALIPLVLVVRHLTLVGGSSLGVGVVVFLLLVVSSPPAFLLVVLNVVLPRHHALIVRGAAAATSIRPAETDPIHGVD